MLFCVCHLKSQRGARDPYHLRCLVCRQQAKPRHSYNHGEQHEKVATFWELHSRWGHPCLKDFELVAANKYIEGAPVCFAVPDFELPCAVCLVAKGLATRIARQPAAHRPASRRGEVLQFDGYGRSGIDEFAPGPPEPRGSIE